MTPENTVTNPYDVAEVGVLTLSRISDCAFVSVCAVLDFASLNCCFSSFANGPEIQMERITGRGVVAEHLEN